jgi:hypothetical protein
MHPRYSSVVANARRGMFILRWDVSTKRVARGQEEKS